MGGFDDLFSDRQLASSSRHDAINRPLSNASAPREGRIRLVHSVDICAQPHAVIFNGLPMRAQVNLDGKVAVASCPYPLGMAEQDAAADLDLARELAKRLFTKGEATKAAEAMGIKPRTFQRFLSGQDLKTADWTRLNSNTRFAQAFAKEKGERGPKLDRTTQEAMGRLARALGPDLLKDAVYEIENLAGIMGAPKTVGALVRLKETAAEVAESVAESAERQKSS